MNQGTIDIGVIGSGRIGRTAAGLFIGAGHTVMISNSRGPASLTDLVEELGPSATAGTVTEAAEFGDVVLEAIPFGEYRTLPAGPLADTILISASNYYRTGTARSTSTGVPTPNSWPSTSRRPGS